MAGVELVRILFWILGFGKFFCESSLMIRAIQRCGHSRYNRYVWLVVKKFWSIPVFNMVDEHFPAYGIKLINALTEWFCGYFGDKYTLALALIN